MFNKIDISPREKILIIYIVLTLATLAVFWQVNHYDFINFDDSIYVSESHIQSGITLDGLHWALSTKYFGLWHPLTWFSFMFDYQFYGLNAGGYHITNLILHIMSALLLFWFFHRMTGAIWRSSFVAALFALHPLHVESVAWIAERKDVLSGFFWMLTLCLYVYYTEKPVIKRYLLVIISFACAMMSKPMVVTLPLIMILLDYWPLRRLQSNGHNLSETKIVGIIPLWQLREKIPFFILSAILAIITLYPSDKPSPELFPLGSRLANAPVSLVTYLEKMFWPHDLAVFYPFVEQLPAWQVLSSALLIVLITTIVIIMVKRLPFLFVGWFWFAIIILPAIKIIPIGNDALADRYTYLSSIGITIMLAWGIPLLIKRDDIRKKVLFPAVVMIIAILAFLTWQQCSYWKNSITLFNHALQVTKDNYLVHNNLGSALFKEGKTEEALDHYNKSLLIKPNYAEAYNNRGTIYGTLSQYQMAFEDFNQAILIKPDYADAYYNRGLIYSKFGQYQNTIEDYSKTIFLNPTDIKAYNNRGTIYIALGQYQKAFEDFNQAILIKPDYADAYYNRGYVHLTQGNNKLGCWNAQKACESGNCKLLALAKGKGYCP